MIKKDFEIKSILEENQKLLQDNQKENSLKIEEKEIKKIKLMLEENKNLLQDNLKENLLKIEEKERE